VELVTSEKNPAKKMARISSTLKKVFARFFANFLACSSQLKSLFSDGQDVKYDLDITPHPHLFPSHSTNSHEYSAHRDNRVDETWE